MAIATWGTGGKLLAAIGKAEALICGWVICCCVLGKGKPLFGLKLTLVNLGLTVVV